MTNNEAINVLKKYVFDDEEAPSTLYEYNQTLKKAIESLQKTTWISVTEQMPELVLNVLTCDEYGNIRIDYTCTDEEDKNKIIFFDKEIFDLPNVIAWMPLPESYIKEE